jgi:hypothetical protein
VVLVGAVGVIVGAVPSGERPGPEWTSRAPVRAARRRPGTMASQGSCSETFPNRADASCGRDLLQALHALASTPMGRDHSQRRFQPTGLPARRLLVRIALRQRHPNKQATLRLVARDQRLMVLLAAAASLVVLVGAVGGFQESLAHAAPLLLVLLPLLAGRFIGEDRIVRLAARACRRGRRPPVPAVPTGWLRRRRAVARGGRLIARGLAERPPPRLAV